MNTHAQLFNNEPDRYLPIANIGRIMKQTLDPPKKKLSQNKKASNKNKKKSNFDKDLNIDEEQKDMRPSEMFAPGPRDDSDEDSINLVGSENQTCKIAKEAKETMQECVTEFLLFVTSEASEICANAKRSTIHGDDIIAAMQKLGFDQYVWLTRYYMIKYKNVLKMEQEQKKKNNQSD